jgi:hypothetical protein
MKQSALFSLVHGSDSFQILELKGRELWALQNLIDAGISGCTPIDNPGPRWSDYIFKLRRRGIDVETVTEAHGGPYKGTHARYILRSVVHCLSPDSGPPRPAVTHPGTDAHGA